MAELPRIRTPWKQQWRRIRYQLLPVVSMACCAFLAAWLWSRRMNTTTTFGEVQFQQTDIVSVVPGKLVPVPNQAPIKQFDRVMEGMLIAKLDDGPALAALAAMRKELGQLESDLHAKAEEIRLADNDRQQGHLTESRRLAIQVDDLRLRSIDRKALMEVDRIELQRQEALYKMVRDAGSAASPREILEVQLARDAAQQRVASNEEALRQSEAQLQEAIQRAGALPQVTTTDLDKLLAPIRAAIGAQQARIEELELQNRSLYIYSPVDGYISNVHRRPGQTVLPGDPIITIVDANSQNIVSYLRQEQRINPSTAMSVEVRSRVDGGPSIRTSVVRVGKHYELVPLHQARDPKVVEWGIPVLISVPEGMDVRPGELVEVRINPADSAQ